MSFELKFFVCWHVSIGYENSKTVSVCPYPEKRNHPGFVNISPTLVIDASMERSSRVLLHWNPKSWIFFKIVRNWLNWILSVPREKKLPWIRRYHSYISNWYINGKVFMGIYYCMETKKLEFFSWKFEIEFWLVPKSLNHLNFCQNQSILFPKNLKLNFDMYFDLCQRAEIVHVGLNMKLYNNIGNVSSSLRGSTSSWLVINVCVEGEASVLNSMRSSCLRESAHLNRWIFYYFFILKMEQYVCWNLCENFRQKNEVIGL